MYMIYIAVLYIYDIIYIICYIYICIYIYIICYIYNVHTGWSPQKNRNNCHVCFFQKFQGSSPPPTITTFDMTPGRTSGCHDGGEFDWRIDGPYGLGTMKGTFLKHNVNSMKFWDYFLGCDTYLPTGVGFRNHPW